MLSWTELDGNECGNLPGPHQFLKIIILSYKFTWFLKVPLKYFFLLYDSSWFFLFLFLVYLASYFTVFSLTLLAVIFFLHKSEPLFDFFFYFPFLLCTFTKVLIPFRDLLASSWDHFLRILIFIFILWRCHNTITTIFCWVFWLWKMF